MGTKGFITFVADGDEKTTRILNSTYPQTLGINTLTWLRSFVGSSSAMGEMAAAIKALRPLTEDSPADDIKRLNELGDVDMGTLNPGHILDAGVHVDDADFPLDSLFAEWGYVIDLNTSVFEVYRGFQQTRHDLGRFAGRCGPKHAACVGGAYLPVALVADHPFASLPTDEAFMVPFGGTR